MYSILTYHVRFIKIKTECTYLLQYLSYSRLNVQKGKNIDILPTQLDSKIKIYNKDQSMYVYVCLLQKER